jgi:hypothetical protein
MIRYTGPFDATDFVKIANQMFARAHRHRRSQRGAADRDIHETASMLRLVGAHEATVQVELDTSVAAAIGDGDGRVLFR